MYTDEVRVRLAPHSHTDTVSVNTRVKSLSRINPMCHATGGSPPPVCFFFSDRMLVNLFFISHSRGDQFARRGLVSDTEQDEMRVSVGKGMRVGRRG